jgi:16S rRNA (cytidine1402-2'-O)-methyltransferase
METPYRSNHLLSDLVNLLPEQAMLSVACEIGTPDEFIKTQNIGQWKKSLPNIHKKRCIFSLQA